MEKRKHGGKTEGSGRKKIGTIKKNITLAEEDVKKLDDMFPDYRGNIQEQLRSCLKHCYENLDFGIINVLKVQSKQNKNQETHYVLDEYNAWESPFLNHSDEARDFDKNVFRCNSIVFNTLTDHFSIEINCKDTVNTDIIKFKSTKKFSDIAEQILEKSRSITDIKEVIYGRDLCSHQDVLEKYTRSVPKMVKEINCLNRRKDGLYTEIQNILTLNNKQKLKEGDTIQNILIDLVAKDKINFLSLRELYFKIEKNEEIIRIYKNIKDDLMSMSIKDFNKKYHREKSFTSDGKEFNQLMKIVQKNKLQIKEKKLDFIPDTHEKIDAYVSMLLSIVARSYTNNSFKKNFALFEPIELEIKDRIKESNEKIVKILEEIYQINQELHRISNKTISLKIKPTEYITIG